MGVPVANGFTGVKTAAVSATIAPGPFLIAVNIDVSMGFRTWRGAAINASLDSALASNSQFTTVFVARTYAAFQNPGTAWTTSTSIDAHAVIRVLTP